MDKQEYTDSTITDICKACNRAASLQLNSWFVNNGKLYQGWWDELSPKSIKDLFKYDERLEWLERNVAGATHLYVLTGFWGVDHTNYYVFEYGEGNFVMTSHMFAMT